MAHKYWRLFFPNSANAAGTGDGSEVRQTVVYTTGVQMRSSIGGPNEAVGGSAYADNEGGGAASNGFLPYSGTRRWQTLNLSFPSRAAGYPHWLAYDFPNPVEIEEITLTGVMGYANSADKNPYRVVLQYSDDNITWASKYFWVLQQPFRVDGTDTRTLNSTNAVQNIFSTETQVYSLINFPAEFLRTTQAQLVTAFRQTAEVRVPQLQMYSLLSGRVGSSRISAWTFTLDGHDFYVLRLGDQETLIYDVSTKQWFNWDSGGYPFWRANTGTVWTDGQFMASSHGTNIIVGDDTWGLLWALDPEQPYDESPNPDVNTEEAFTRVFMGQLPQRGRVATPCFNVYLQGDNYGLTSSMFTPGVTLEYSDDAGKTFQDAGTITVTPDTVDQEYTWRSLGQIRAPGRLFKITDNGIFARIDDLIMDG